MKYFTNLPAWGPDGGGGPSDSGVRRCKTEGTGPTKVETKQLGDSLLTELQDGDLYPFLSIFKHVTHVLSSRAPPRIM